MAGDKGKRMTPDEIDRIVEMKLDHATEKQIMAEVGIQGRTVRKHWRAWLASQAEERAESIAVEREQISARYERIALHAARQYLAAVADDRHADARGYLAEQRQALKELARVQGLEAPVRQEVTVHGDLDQRLAGLLGELNPEQES